MCNYVYKKALKYDPILSCSLANEGFFYLLLDRENEAKEHKIELSKMYPSFSLEWVKQLFSRSKNPAYYDFAIEALRKAGIPEHPS